MAEMAPAESKKDYCSPQHCEGRKDKVKEEPLGPQSGSARFGLASKAAGGRRAGKARTRNDIPSKKETHTSRPVGLSNGWCGLWFGLRQDAWPCHESTLRKRSGAWACQFSSADSPTSPSSITRTPLHVASSTIGTSLALTILPSKSIAVTTCAGSSDCTRSARRRRTRG